MWCWVRAPHLVQQCNMMGISASCIITARGENLPLSLSISLFPGMETLEIGIWKTSPCKSLQITNVTLDRIQVALLRVCGCLKCDRNGWGEEGRTNEMDLYVIAYLGWYKWIAGCWSSSPTKKKKKRTLFKVFYRESALVGTCFRTY